MAIAMAKLGRDLCTLGEGARSKSGRVGARCLARARAPIAGGSRRAGRRPRFDWAGSRKMVVLRSAQFTASELQTVVVPAPRSRPTTVRHRGTGGYKSECVSHRTLRTIIY